MIALDARTGKVRWDVIVADYRSGYSITGAPLAIKGKVIVGMSGGDMGARGFLDAYEAETGTRSWRFWTVPAPGEPGSETWKGASWKRGGAATWMTGTYDVELNLLYWGTGNPGPDYSGNDRLGDNLYSCALLAIDVDSGKLRWHFQFTPHDLHDWDANHVPVLFDAVVAGRSRKLVAEANRNGFYYVLDRESGQLVTATQYARQTWASGIDNQGRPRLLPNQAPTPTGTITYPGLHGATNWMSPTYDPRTGIFFVAVREAGTIYYEGTSGVPLQGAYFLGGDTRGIPGVEPRGWIKALNGITGRPVWEFELQSPPWSGLLSTGGDLLFSGTSEGLFIALHSSTGRLIWSFQTGGAMFSNPVTFMLKEKQFVVSGSGQALFAFALDGN